MKIYFALSLFEVPTLYKKLVYVQILSSRCYFKYEVPPYSDYSEEIKY